MENLNANKFNAVLENATIECCQPAEAEIIELLKNNPNGNFIVLTNHDNWINVWESTLWSAMYYTVVAVGTIDNELYIKAYDCEHRKPNTARWMEIGDLVDKYSMKHAILNASLYHAVVTLYDQAMSKEAADQISFEE